jgi:hypothetical protein
MALTLPADAGEPMSAVLIASAKVKRHEFPALTRQVSLRNTATNTLWISLDQRNWIDVACGTSWDERVTIREMWYCTQVGRTRFVVIGLALMSMEFSSTEDRDSGQTQLSTRLPSRKLKDRR